MSPELARFLLAGVEEFKKNPNLPHWNGFSEPALYALITALTGQEMVDEALKILAKIASQELSPTIPPNLKELVDALEERRRKIEEMREEAGETVEEQIRAANLIINRLKQIKIEPEVRPSEAQPAPAVPPPTPPIITAEGEIITPAPIETSPPTPRTPPPKLPTQKITEAPAVPDIFVQITKPVMRGITATLSSLPAQAVRGVISLGEEAFGKKTPEDKSALALAQIGVTAQSFRQSTDVFQKENPLTERGIVNALLRQASVLTQFENQHRFFTTLTHLVHPPQTVKVTIAARPPLPREERPVLGIGQKIENLRLIIDGLSGQIVKVERFIPAPTPTPITPQPPTLPKEILEPLTTARKNIISQIAIAIKRLPVEIGRLFAGPVGRAAVSLAKGPGQTLLVGGLRLGFSSLGALARGTIGVVGGIARVGGVVVAAGGAAAGGGAGLSMGVILAIVLIIVVALPLLGFTQQSYQGAFLPPEAVEESPFIGVAKTTPKTSFTNQELPQTVTYTIVVEAKKGKLTNVKVKDSFVVSGPIKVTLPEQSWTVPQITTSWTQSFSVTFPAELRDSLVTDIVTVSAEVEGQPPQTQTTSLTIIIGSPPQDCPSGWPLAHGYITQGPDGPTSHIGKEAIDIGGNPIGTTVSATHRGKAIKAPTPGGGKVVEVIGICGKTFNSRYLHLSAYNEAIIGKDIERGTILGYVGNTGTETTGTHLHYEFKDRVLPMQPPYIPVNVPRGCSSRIECGISW